MGRGVEDTGVGVKGRVIRLVSLDVASAPLSLNDRPPHLHPTPHTYLHRYREYTYALTHCSSLTSNTGRDGKRAGLVRLG